MNVEPDRSTDPPRQRHFSPPPRLTSNGGTSGTTTQTDTCSQHNPGKLQGRPNEKPGLEAHRANRPTRLRSPTQSPCPGSLGATAGPGQSLHAAVSCREERQPDSVRPVSGSGAKRSRQLKRRQAAPVATRDVKATELSHPVTRTHGN